MGKKGKKRTTNEPGSADDPPQQQQQQRQPQQQQQQQQQRQPQQQQQQQQRQPQQQQQQQQRQPQQQQQQQQRQPQQQQQQQRGQPQQQQWQQHQPQPGIAQVAQATAGIAQLSVDQSGTQQSHPGHGRGRGRGWGSSPHVASGGQQAQGRIPGMPQPSQQAHTAQGAQQPKAPWGQQAQAPSPGMPQQAQAAQGAQQPKAPWGQQAQAPSPGMPQQAQAAQGAQQPKAPWGQQAQAPSPGMPQQAQAAQGAQQARAPIEQQARAPQQARGKGSGDGGQSGRERAPSVAGSTASHGDTGSVKSGSSGGKGGKPQQAAQAAPGSTPVKTSLSPAMQATYYNQIPKRKNPNCGGKAGVPITVETNMIPISFKPNFARVVCHYDVKLDPDKPRFMYRAVVEAVRIKHFRNLYPAFDGRCNLFAAGTLPFGDSLNTEIEVENHERQKTMTFKVTLLKVQDIDMSWIPKVGPGFAENEKSQIAIQALDVILRASSIRQNRTVVGRSFFSPPTGQVVSLGNGMDLWVGTFQSAVLGWKPYFNVDVAHKAFPRSQKVLDLFQELCGDPRSREPVTARDVEYGRHKLSSFLKGLKVTYEIPGHPSSRRTMGINDLGRNAETANFELDSGEVTTVKNYFARVKRYTIRRPDLPTLWVGSRNKSILIPAELCVIEPGQVTQKKMDEQQTATMIKYAATDAQTRKRKIMEGFAKMRINEDPASKEFGVSVGAGFETVKARVLNPPILQGKENLTMMVRKGVWRAQYFFSAMHLPDKSWTILNLNHRTQEPALRAMVEHLKAGGTAVGMQIGEPLTPFKKMDAPMRDVREIVQFFNEKKAQGLKLIIVVVPDKTGPTYGKVKQVAELNVGVLTQCLKAVTVERKMNNATAGNILLKINSKLNGTNQIFAPKVRPRCLAEPCMIVGADVTHPSPDAVGIPSIAAVAASHEPNAFRYNIKIQLQPPKTEIILNFEQIIKDQLMFFYKSSGQKPVRIIYYRDGVSEGQFPQVMHHELQAIRNACRKLGGNTPYQPKITFLVVQKRHHIRLFPTDPRNSDDRNGNVQAGTVVDTDITHPSHIDFYLVSHASIQGTARPTKYRCLWDDSNMSEDEIEQLTYYLCHMFARCTRSVSYPAPTYYAHLAAFRARALTNEVDIRLNNLEEEQRMRMTIKDDIIVKNPMFFV